jgi:hypothetical protein
MEKPSSVPPGAGGGSPMFKDPLLVGILFAVLAGFLTISREIHKANITAVL